MTAYFGGNLVEVLKVPFIGTNGHICVDTRDIKRAVAMLKRKGVQILEKNCRYDDKGNLINVFLEEEIGGFGFHVRQRPKA